MTKPKNPTFLQRIMALNTVDMTVAEIAKALDEDSCAVSVALYQGRKRGVDIPYKHDSKRKSKPSVAAKKAPQGKDSGEGGKEPGVRDCRRCKGCRYWRPLSMTSESTMKACHYCYDTGHRRGCPAGSGCTKREERQMLNKVETQRSGKLNE